MLHRHWCLWALQPKFHSIILTVNIVDPQGPHPVRWRVKLRGSRKLKFLAICNDGMQNACSNPLSTFPAAHLKKQKASCIAMNQWCNLFFGHKQAALSTIFRSLQSKKWQRTGASFNDHYGIESGPHFDFPDRICWQRFPTGLFMSQLPHRSSSVLFAKASVVCHSLSNNSFCFEPGVTQDSFLQFQCNVWSDCVSCSSVLTVWMQLLPASCCIALAAFCLFVTLFILSGCILLSTVSVGKASNTKCYVELMSSSSCFDSS